MSKDVLIGQPIEVKYYDVDVERSILSSCITDRKALAYCQQNITVDAFYLPLHRIIYTAIVETWKEHSECDVILIYNYCRQRGLDVKQGDLTTVIGNYYNVHSLEIKPYVLILKELQLGRNLMNASQNIANRLQSEKDALTVLDKLEQDIRSLRKGVTISKSTDVGSSIADYIEVLKTTKVTGSIPTNYIELDTLLGGGFNKGEYVVIGGRPSMGKTTLALNFLSNFEKAQQRCLFFSLEMTKERIYEKWISSIGGIYGYKLQNRNFNDQDLQAFESVKNEMKKWKMVVDDTAGHTIDTIRAVSSLRLDEQGLDIIVVDHMHLMNNPKGHSRENEVSQISKGLKAIAKDLNICVVALAQLNRAVTDKQDKTPQLNDLRESGSIEQDADVVIFIHSNDYYDHDKKKNEIRDCQMILSKNRMGALGTINLKFEMGISRFRQEVNF